MSLASTKRRKQNEAAFRKLRKKQAKIAGRQPLRDPDYLAFIRTLPCCLPDCAVDRKELWADSSRFTVEAAHVGERGLRQKCSDYEAIPLCAWHHRISPLSHHRLGKLFWKSHDLDREALIAAYRMAYAELMEGEA